MFQRIYVTQRFLYWQLIEHDHNYVIVPRIGRHCPEDIDWKSVYNRACKIPCNTKLQEFQYKFFNDILIINYWLLKWSLKDDDICTFCHEETEDICHVFLECMFTQHLWHKVYIEYIFKTREPVKLSVYLGVDDVKECLIIFECKKIIYLSQLECIIPTYDRFIRYLDGVRHMEFLVAEKKNKVDVSFEMWSDV